MSEAGTRVSEAGIRVPGAGTRQVHGLGGYRDGVNEPDRRVFFGMLAVGLASVIAGCAPAGNAEVPPTSAPEPLPPEPAPSRDVPKPAEASSGPARVLTQGPTDGNRIALTVDDGYNDEVVAGYVSFAVRTGIHLTFSPNGRYAHAWEPHADALKPLVERGQIQIINHTFNHPDLRKMSDTDIRVELERNEEWVNRMFGTSTRPYYRPPYGFHNAHIDGVAADLGYRNTVMWSGSYGDSKVLTPEYLMSQASRYFQPGVIMLGHANHPTVLGLFDQIVDLIRQRQLNPVTLQEMFATHGV
ncbi:polysaccharide deacetylase [Amycolatopsis taiwanensis]|uniref:Polysaccharide deacetylase n=1 Tax=Amycolatopsis taiwanensis TaxID=342230 RepID=A0A9W6QZ35_9PSEU|nr:polysaccharide deacetylase [Amycolatopsis taiwanensis]